MVSLITFINIKGTGKYVPGMVTYIKTSMLNQILSKTSVIGFLSVSKCRVLAENLNEAKMLLISNHTASFMF